MASEKDLDRALHDALNSDERFRSWFLSQLGGQGAYSRLTFCRSDHPWGKVRLILPNAVSGALEPVDREGETDVLAVFESASGERLGVHVENKLASGVFTPFQPEVLAARAEHWVRNPKYGDYLSWKTVLLAPSSFLARNEVVARKFMYRLAHEQVAEFVSIFAQGGNT